MYSLAIGDLGHARWTEAIERLDSMEEDGSGAKDPVMAALMLPDKIEAAVRAGRLDAARAALAHFEAWAGHSGAPSAQPRLASCRAQLAEGETATEHYEQALHLRADARPFDLARIRLLYGEHLRRERRRSDARTQLRAALEGFERLGADPWAERARAELRATGETARKRDPSTVDQLTAQELQIARYVAAGLSNKEVAAQLFLSPRTIDAHLRNVFSKLGIKSRTQLARVALGDEDGDFTDATGGARDVASSACPNPRTPPMPSATTSPTSAPGRCCAAPRNCGSRASAPPATRPRGSGSSSPTSASWSRSRAATRAGASSCST